MNIKKEVQELSKELQGFEKRIEKIRSFLGCNKDNRPITEKVKTYQDACDVLGLDCQAVLPYDIDTEDGEEMWLNSAVKLKVIARALNEGWTPNWSDTNEYKYYPYFQMPNSKTGFGFSYTGYYFADTCSGAGSRLVFKSRELAEYAGKKFEKEYKEFYV